MSPLADLSKRWHIVLRCTIWGPLGLLFFSAMRSKCALSYPNAITLTATLFELTVDYMFWCMVFSHRRVHTFSVHQCTGRPIRSGVINWLAVIKNQVDSVAGSFNSPRVFVYLSTGEETAVQLFAQGCIHSRTEAPLLVPYRWNRRDFRFPRRLSVSQSVCLSSSLSVCLSVHSVSVHLVFRTFLSRPLRYWLEIWYMNLSWHNTDQVSVLSCLTYFYRS